MHQSNPLCALEDITKIGKFNILKFLFIIIHIFYIILKIERLKNQNFGNLVLSNPTITLLILNKFVFLSFKNPVAIGRLKY